MNKSVPPPSAGLWRILILDRTDAQDPKWLLAIVASPADVRPADPAREAPDEVTAHWAGARTGRAVAVTPLRASVWRVEVYRPGP